MRLLGRPPYLIACLLVVGLAAAPATANEVLDEEPPRVPEDQFTLDLVPLAGALGYAHRIGPRTSIGIKVGFGFDVLSMIPLSGAHFTDDSGWAYEKRDGANGKKFIEIGHVGLFVRQWLPRRFHFEGGLRVSSGTHKDSSDDDAGGANFLGAYGALFWGGPVLSVGARLAAGIFSETPDRQEFGLLFTPLIFKLSTR